MRHSDHSPSDRQSLLLATRQLVATDTTHSIVARVQLHLAFFVLVTLVNQIFYVLNDAASFFLLLDEFFKDGDLLVVSLLADFFDHVLLKY